MCPASSSSGMPAGKFMLRLRPLGLRSPSPRLASMACHPAFSTQSRKRTMRRTTLGRVVLRDVGDAMIEERVAETIHRRGDVPFCFRSHTALGEAGNHLAAIEVLQPVSDRLVIKDGTYGSSGRVPDAATDWREPYDPD